MKIISFWGIALKQLLKTIDKNTQKQHLLEKTKNEGTWYITYQTILTNNAKIKPMHIEKTIPETTLKHLISQNSEITKEILEQMCVEAINCF